MKSSGLVHSAVLLVITLICCSVLSPVFGKDISVFVSIPPQAYFVERIGGDRVDVQILVQPGQSPATYEPTPRQMSALAEAVMYFRIGVPFENAFLPKLEEILPDIRIVDTRTGISLRKMTPSASREAVASEDHAHHADHKDGEEIHHMHEGSDPHIWLSPPLVKIQAHTIAKTLGEIDKDGQKVYETNLASFIQELDSLDVRLREILLPVRGKSFLVFHPSWGYFADSYELKQVPIELEGKSPSGRQLARVLESMESENIRVIFVQPQFSKSSAEAIADAVGGSVFAIDPLARNYSENLVQVARILRETLEFHE